MSPGWQLVWFIAVNAGLWALVWAMPTLVVRVRRIHLQAQGVALPGLVLLLPEATEQVLRHELVHQDQMRRYSPLGAALFLGFHYGRGFLRHRRISRSVLYQLWHENPLERQAIARMHQTDPLPKVWEWRG